MKRLLIGALLEASTSWLLAASPRPQWTPDPAHAAQRPAATADNPTDPNSDWIPCAREFQTCYTPGPAQVRFGGGGRYSAVHNMVGEVECTIPTFGGDPARRVEKICEYKLGWPEGTPHPIREAGNPDWVDCAKEEEVCRFRGTRLVRFGIEGSHYYRTAQREIRCSVNEFGDPARRIPKVCQVKRDALDHRGDRDQRDERRDEHPDEHRGEAAAGSGRPSNRWAMCAVEGETCRVSSPTVIRFGREGNYTYRNTSNEVACLTSLFGDPAPGVVKLCEANTIPPEQSAARRPDPDEIPPLEDALWKTCALEGQTCNFRGGEHVRYGARGAYKVIFATQALRCNAGSFGGDPARGTPKRCDIYRP